MLKCIPDILSKLPTKGKKRRSLVSRYTLQRHTTENSKQIFPEKELHGISPNFHTYVSVSDLYISMIGLPIFAAGNMWTDPGNR
jgi:hypothetical protein